MQMSKSRPIDINVLARQKKQGLRTLAVWSATGMLLPGGIPGEYLGYCQGDYLGLPRGITYSNYLGRLPRAIYLGQFT